MDEELENRFRYHQPATDDRKFAHDSVREISAYVAGWMTEALPDGREKAIVMTKIEEAMFWANAAIARQP